MIFSRHPALLSLAACAAAAACAQAQSTSSTGTAAQQQPAPIVRTTPNPQAAQPKPSTTAPKTAVATGSTGAIPTPQAGKPGTILTQSFSVHASHPASGATGATAKTASTSAATVPAKTATPPPAPPTPKPAPPKSSAPAQQTPTPSPSSVPPANGTLNRNVIVLDPAHGGIDGGSRIGESLQEKDITLAFAFKLRSLLTARGFTVDMTRDTDAASPPNNPGGPLTLDDRAGIANHARAAACLLIHATGSGNGVHLYTSELDAAPGEATVLPWLTAQAAWVPQSKQLETALAAAFTRSHIPLINSAASVRPVDSLTCPALILEIAPKSGDDETTINDTGYQQQIAEVVATALMFWKNQAQPPVHLAPPEKTDSAATTATGGTP